LLKRIVSGIMLTLLLVGMLTLTFYVQPVRAGTITVPDDYPTIQEAINAANLGDTIYVKSGIYYESLKIDKCLKLIGEGKETTIIDGSPITPELDYIIIFLKDMRNVYISGFTLRNGPDGIELDHSHNCTITDNIITMNYCGGIVLFDSNSNNLTGNTIVSNGAAGIDIVWSDNNYIIQNNLLDNTYGLHLQDAYNNIIYHNSFLDNDYYPASSTQGSVNVWDNGYPSGGNYWSDYEDRYPDAEEINGSGIWDMPYVINENNQDNYPLMEPWTPPPPIPTTIAELKNEIEELGSTGDIDNQGIVRGLVAKLNVAQKLVDNGKTAEAQSILEEDLIPQVQELSGIHITPEAADILIKSAECILAHL
jgi:parallel beta-helix repeat protein